MPLAVTLSKVIDVDKDKCVNCHKCISVCPVKYCNDASGDHVVIDASSCIGCGECLKACTHEARIIIDDTGRFFSDLAKGEKIVAVVAPSVAAVFPDQYLRFNGWLKSAGVKAIFDVSFGAELTVKSYLEHIRANGPKAVIAQPCPAIVTYIEVYRPDLLKHLAPADSPMMHTMKMIRHFYPAYAKHKMAVISPCIAKKREFDEVGIGDYNVTMTRLKEYFGKTGIDLSKYPEVDFDNDPAERAVLFSSPGGLMRTALREVPGIFEATRKIEGPHTIYPYLDGLASAIESGTNPLLIDCLNCELGCNGGTGTGNAEKHADELEHHIEKRKEKMEEIYRTRNATGKAPSLSKVRRTIDRYWKPGIYERRYRDLSQNFTIKPLTGSELEMRYVELKKAEDKDIMNCASCGYNACDMMAAAIAHGLNRADNCHLYIQKGMQEQMNQKKQLIGNVNTMIHEITDSVGSINRNIERLVVEINAQFDLLGNTVTSVRDGIVNIQQMEEELNTNSTLNLVSITEEGGKKISDLNENIGDIYQITDEMNSIIAIIDNIAEQTNMLSINAAIQSARSGQYGKSFAVVAREIKTLSENTGKHLSDISKSLTESSVKIDRALKLSGASGSAFVKIAEEVHYVDSYIGQVIEITRNLSQNGETILVLMDKLTGVSEGIKSNSGNIRDEVQRIESSLKSLQEASQD